MFIKENIMLAIAGLKANKMRSLLTMLGIIIGISSVIAIVSIGNSMSAALNDTLSQLGVNNIVCYVDNKSDDYNVKPEDSDLFSDNDLDTLQSIFRNSIKNISIENSYSSGSIKRGYKNAYVDITGVNSGYDEVNNVKMIKGRFISNDDVKGNKRTAVVSDKFIKKIFKNNENPLGKEIKLTCGENIESYYIVGVYKYQTSMFENMGMGSDAQEYTTLYTTISSTLENKEIKNYRRLTIQPVQGVDSRTLADDLNKYLKKLYKNNKNFIAEAFALENDAEAMNTVLNMISLAISVIAAISLLVGGIGVMNIMLVSVTERTREIGTRKALGARSYHIQVQFITEAVIICAIGGVIGISIGVGAGALVSSLMKVPLSVSVSTILISFIFSMSIGVFFGFYPARKAAKLDPIEALRYE